MVEELQEMSLLVCKLYEDSLPMDKSAIASNVGLRLVVLFTVRGVMNRYILQVLSRRIEISYSYLYDIRYPNMILGTETYLIKLIQCCEQALAFYAVVMVGLVTTMGVKILHRGEEDIAV